MESALTGKVVLITGAARGIGAQTARLAAAQGARVSLAGMEPGLLAELAAELGERHVWFECDVTDQSTVEAAVEGTVQALGGIDVVVANAGVANNGTVAVSPVEVLTRTIDVNLQGVLRTVSATLPHVTERRGYYLLISSAAAFTAMPGMAAYCASKAGVEHLGNALRLELAHKGVQVGTAHPIWIDTDLVRDQKAESRTFREALRKLPPPLNSYIDVNTCAAALLEGVRRRSRRVHIPRSLGPLAAMRWLVLGPIGEFFVKRAARTSVPQLEAEVRQRGRYFGRHSAALSQNAGKDRDAERLPPDEHQHPANTAESPAAIDGHGPEQPGHPG